MLSTASIIESVAERVNTVDSPLVVDPVMVNKVVDTLVETDVSEIVPEVGMQIVGAPPYAESAHNLPAVEGQITRTIRGVQPTRGVRIGASSQMARFLIAAREYGPTIRFALNWLLDSPVKTALKEQNWKVVEIDWENKPTSNTENNTMQWKASRSVGRVDTSPLAVIDRGTISKGPMALYSHPMR
jgi:predicted fused transcriptional regulator/phosphomethylpyrimidine kinase